MPPLPCPLPSNAQVLVSPWGWGEWSLKDHEAILCGCLVLKPEAGRYTAQPPIYDPGLCMGAPVGCLTPCSYCQCCWQVMPWAKGGCVLAAR